MDALKKEWLRDHIRENHRYTLNDNQNHNAWNELGVAYMNLGRLECAKKPLLKALKLQPKNSDYWFNIGLLYDKKGKKDLAMRLYKISLKLNPRNRYPLFNISFHYEQSGLIEKAVAIWERLIKEHPYDFSAFACLADFLYKNQKLSKIVELLEPFRADIYRDYPALWFIAEMYYKIGEYQLAKEILIQLYQHDPKYFDFSITLVKIFLKENKLREALFYLEKAIIVEPFNHEAQFQRLLLKAKLDCPDFLESLLQTIQIHPGIALQTLKDKTFSKYQENTLYKKSIKQARKYEKYLSKLVFVDGVEFSYNPYLRQMHYKQLSIALNFLRLLGFSNIVFFFDSNSHYELGLYNSHYEDLFSQGIIQRIEPNNSSNYKMLPIMAQITNGIIISNKELARYTNDKSIKRYLKKNQFKFLLNHQGLFLKTKSLSFDEEYYKKILYKSIDILKYEK